MSKAQIDLQKHNQLRAKHHAPPLVLSSWLSQRAQNWADHLAGVQKLQHSDCMVNGKRVGENIYWTSGTANGGEATKRWYDEVKSYNYSNGEGTWPKCGHFTQVAWKYSKEVGFGYRNGYVVANYYPPGNLNGHYQDNVKHP
jgi:uncharacterized protein YkwD